MHRYRSRVFVFVACCVWSLTTSAERQPGDWPQFRGINASGVADGMQPPTNWDLETNHNFRWKARIPGLAHASPIISGERLFVVTVMSDVEAPSASAVREGVSQQ